jgi:hypothetical protein
MSKILLVALLEGIHYYMLYKYEVLVGGPPMPILSGRHEDEDYAT